MAQHHAAHEPQWSETPPPPSTLNPLRLAWRHKFLVTLGLVLGVGAGAVLYARATPLYQSRTLVLVVKKTPDALPLGGTDQRVALVEDYLSTHQTLIRSPMVVGHAVKQAKLGELPSFAGQGDPTGAIIDALKVTREMNAGSPTTILNISYQSESPEDAAVVVRAVAESYQHMLSSKYKNVTEEAVKLIKEANSILEDKLTKKQKEYDDFVLKHPGLWKGKDGISANQERRLALETKRSALLVKETDLKGRLEAIDRAVKAGTYSRQELLAMVAQQAEKKPGLELTTAASALEERLIILELEEKTLLESFGNDYPMLRTVRNQIAALKIQIEKQHNASSKDAEKADPLKAYIQGLQLDLENTRLSIEGLGAVIDKEHETASKMWVEEKTEESLRSEIARHQVLFSAVAKRLDEVNIMKNFGGGYEAEVIAPPGHGAQVYPSAFNIFALTGFFGLVLGLGLAYAAELSDHSFRSADEIRRLGLPLVGHVPRFQTRGRPVAVKGGAVDQSLCTVARPRSREAEAYRGVRTAVYFASRAAGHKVIQVTSPDMGDGKTTLASNLAISIAQSEKKVILIDADFRRPRLHKLFDVPGDVGLASLINGEAELDEVIQPSAVPGLYVLPCGPIPPNPAELLTLPRFQEVLAVLRDRFDFAVIDTPPLLAVTDPCVVVPYVDGVLLTLRLSKNAKPHARRAREILATLNANVLGVVVNGVTPDGKGYGYRYGGDYYAEGGEDANHRSNGHSKPQATAAGRQEAEE
jgi:capsular exopolysaccharide synthesis family protein